MSPPPPLPLWEAMRVIEKAAYRAWRTSKVPAMDLESACATHIVEVEFVVLRRKCSHILVSVTFHCKPVTKSDLLLYTLKRTKDGLYQIDPVT